VRAAGHRLRYAPQYHFNKGVWREDYPTVNESFYFYVGDNTNILLCCQSVQQ
jgi:hypothetical protein